MEVKLTINGTQIAADKNDTILKAARRAGVYIPTLCYLSKCEPISSCRLCVVEAENQDGLILACQTKVVDGLVVNTNSQRLAAERQKIMQLYCVNHPLECGVCDKSGECELQNKTLEFGVTAQQFMAVDQKREIKDWGLIQYDPSLCVLCEKCVHTCNEIIGDDAIEIKVGGYKSIIGPKNSDTLDCTFCGECIAVCPVGALISKEFKYRSNAWELKKVPSSCAHCSSACSLTYESKSEGTESLGQKIYRVSNDFEFRSLCQAGRFGFDFDNKATKDAKAFDKAVGALKSARTIKFNSFITNEEAKILQTIKEKNGVKLVNSDAYNFKKFMSAYSSVSGSNLYSADSKEVHASNFVVTLGSMIKTDNPVLRFAVNNAVTMNKGAAIYMHPVNDAVISGLSKNMLQLNYKPLAEEKTLLALIDAFCDADKLPSDIAAKLKSYEVKYTKTVTEKVKEKVKELVKEKVVAEDGTETEIEKEVEKEVEKSVSKDVEMISSKLFEQIGLSLEDKEKMQTLKKDKAALILGADLYAHPRAENIARLAALFEKTSGFKVLIIPSQTNTLGVSMICDLDEKAEGFTVGYNEEGDFVLTSLGAQGRDNALDMPALNQQEGTFVNIDKRVVPLNAAIAFGGYELNDLANAIGIKKEFTIDYTKELFEAKAFDDLPNRFLNDGTEDRGYVLKAKEVDANGKIEDIAELEEMNGTLIYVSAPVGQFNAFTAKCSQVKENANTLYVGKAAAEGASLEDGGRVSLKTGSYTVKIDQKISSNIVLAPAYEPNNPGFETLREGYKFRPTEIIKG